MSTKVYLEGKPRTKEWEIREHEARKEKEPVKRVLLVGSCCGTFWGTMRNKLADFPDEGCVAIAFLQIPISQKLRADGSRTQVGCSLYFWRAQKSPNITAAEIRSEAKRYCKRCVYLCPPPFVPTSSFQLLIQPVKCCSICLFLSITTSFRLSDLINIITTIWLLSLTSPSLPYYCQRYLSKNISDHIDSLWRNSRWSPQLPTYQVPVQMEPRFLLMA